MRPTVGDKVRILDTEISYHKVGDIGVIVDDDEDACPYWIECNGSNYYYRENQVELMGPESAAPDFGMSPDALADFFDAFIRAAKGRITGTGADQYYGSGSQKFEHMCVAELIQYAREEVQDIAVYGAMLDVRLQRVLEALNSKGISVVNL